jgi:SAM-dependent methyltransferase
MPFEQRNGPRAIMGALARHPRDLPRYLRYSLPRPSAPLKSQLPWYSWPAIDYLEAHLCSTDTVYEYGSGGSTLFFGAHAGRVISVEHDPAWADAVMAVATKLGLSNVTVLLREADFTTTERFAKSPFANALPSEPASLVAIDSYDDENLQLRMELIRPAEARLKLGGILLLDDSWRYPELRHSARSRHSFAGVGPGRRRVTVTDVLEY